MSLAQVGPTMKPYVWAFCQCGPQRPHIINGPLHFLPVLMRRPI